MPKKLEPMHAELADAPFNRPDWVWEPKLDGYRVLAFVDEKGVSLRSRRGLELAGDFPSWPRSSRSRGASMILDGEIVAFDESGKPSFNAHAEPQRADDAGVLLPSTCCISPASTCARRRTPTGAATSRNACCRRRWCSSSMPPTTASRSMPPRSPAASRA